MSELRNGMRGEMPSDRPRVREIRERFMEFSGYRRIKHHVDGVLQRAAHADVARRDASRDMTRILGNLEVALDDLRCDLRGENPELNELTELSSMSILEVDLDELLWDRHEELFDPLIRERLEQLTAELEGFAGIRMRTSTGRPDLMSLIETAANVVDDLLGRERHGRWDHEADDLLTTVIDFIKAVCVEILAAGLAAFAVAESPVTEMIKATIVVTATAIGMRTADTVKPFLRPPNLAPQLTKVIETLDGQREDLVVLLDALSAEADDTSLLEDISVHAIDIQGLAYAGHRLALLADWDEESRHSYSVYCDDLADYVSVLTTADDQGDFSAADLAEELQSLVPEFPQALTGEISMRKDLWARTDHKAATTTSASEGHSATSPTSKMSPSEILRRGTFGMGPPKNGPQATDPNSPT